MKRNDDLLDEIERLRKRIERLRKRECPVCARRRKAKAKAMKRWRENQK